MYQEESIDTGNPEKNMVGDIYLRKADWCWFPAVLVYFIIFQSIVGCSSSNSERALCRMREGFEGTCPNDMVFVPNSNCCIDRYEASIDTAGAARSLEGQIPASEISWESASEACEEVGKTLCPVDVWEAACTAGGERLYPYGNEYLLEACNSENRTTSPIATGTMEGCEGGLQGLFDMSGNVFEWTATCLDDLDACDVRGGGYDQDFEERYSCHYGAAVETIGFTGVGFRCCTRAERTH